jgi:hypothetical protein
MSESIKGRSLYSETNGLVLPPVLFTTLFICVLTYKSHMGMNLKKHKNK